MKRNLLCSRVEEVLLRSQSAPSPVKSPLLPTQDEVSPELAQNLVELYLRYMHDKPHALFHEPLLKQAVANGSVSLVVLFSILGLAALYELSYFLFGCPCYRLF